MRIIGGISLNIGDDNRGFWLGKPWRGQGLMTEACDKVTDYWFVTLRFPVLRVAKAVANTASRRISEKQGMRVVAIGERDYVSGRLPAKSGRLRLRSGTRLARRIESPNVPYRVSIVETSLRVQT